MSKLNVERSVSNVRKVIYSQMVSLDGYIEGVQQEIDWSAPDEELFQYIMKQEEQIDTHLYGRKTYQNMLSYWPIVEENKEATEQEIAYAQIWKKVDKIVFSRSLTELEGKARLVRDDIAETIAELKGRKGDHLSLGGANLASTFMKLNLIDEYQLYVHPIILGGGTRLLKEMEDKQKLQLAEVVPFASGVVWLRYLRS